MNLIGLFEKGGGGRNEKQPELKETKCQKLSSIVSKISEFEEKKGLLRELQLLEISENQ